MSEVKRQVETQRTARVNQYDQPDLQSSSYQASGMRIIASETKEMQPITKTLQTEYEIKSSSQPRVQSQRVRTLGPQMLTTGLQGFQGQNFQLNQNCVAAQPLCMNVIVVSKEEIEAPWRLECEYLQSLIAELERRKDTQIVEKIVEKEKIVTDNSRVEYLEGQLRSLQNEKDSLQSKYESQLRAANNEILQLKNELNLRSGSDGKLSQMEAEFMRIRNQLEETIRTQRQKIDDLESAYRRLEGENERLKLTIKSRDEEISQLKFQLQGLQSNLQEANKFRDLEMQIKIMKEENSRLEGLLQKANQDNQMLRQRINDMEQDSYSKNNDLVMRIRESEVNQIITLQSEIDRLSGLLRGKEAELDEWRMRYESLESQGTTVIQEKVTYLSQEVEVWKQKFIKANHEYNKCQEELTMCQAELESMKKQGKKEVVVSSRTVTRTGGTTTTTAGGTTGYQTTTGGQLGVGGAGGYTGSSQYTRSEVTRRSGNLQP